MRNTTRLMIGAACIFAAVPASAATFIFSGGNYVPGTTSPTPLLAPDQLDITTSSTKLFDGITFTNQSGTVNWSDGAIGLVNAAAINNQSLWYMTGDDQLFDNGGASSTFTNSGIFRKSVSVGVTSISSGINFVNSGTIDAQTGTISFTGGGATFNAGSIFTGAGQVDIGTSIFNGGFTSSNVDFETGIFTGNSAALTGTADWNAGTFSGTWAINSGSTLDATTGSTKLLDAANFTNNGAINWQDGAIGLVNASQLVNNGTITATGDDQLFDNGGASSTFTNSGLIQKTAGPGTTTLANGIGLINNGTINVLSGTIALPTAFTNAGTLGGTGTFTSTNLTNGGSIAPGAPGTTGTLALTGTYAQTAFGALNTQLASTGSFDLFNISGTAALDGTLALSCILSCAINSGDSFVILNSVGSLSGTFSNVTTSGFLSGFTYNVIYDYAADLVRLDVINAGTIITPGAVPEPATWMMMLFGFGLIGSTLRRRNATGVSAAV